MNAVIATTHYITAWKWIISSLRFERSAGFFSSSWRFVLYWIVWWWFEGYWAVGPSLDSLMGKTQTGESDMTCNKSSPLKSNQRLCSRLVDRQHVNHWDIRTALKGEKKHGRSADTGRLLSLGTTVVSCFYCSMNRPIFWSTLLSNIVSDLKVYNKYGYRWVHIQSVLEYIKYPTFSPLFYFTGSKSP